MLQRPKNEVILLVVEKTHTTSRRSVAYSATPWLIPYEMPNPGAVFETVILLSLLMTVQTSSTFDFMRPVYGRPERSKTVKTAPPPFPQPNMQVVKPTQILCSAHDIVTES